MPKRKIKSRSTHRSPRKNKSLLRFWPLFILAAFLFAFIFKYSFNGQAVQGSSSYKWSVPVLTYHWIACPDSSVPAASRYLYVCPSLFRAELQALKDNGWTLMTGKEFVTRFKANNPPPPKTVVFTDDGSQSADTVTAVNILNEFGDKATFFISPGLLGQTGNLTWSYIKTIYAQGQDIQNHSMYHKTLTNLNGTKPGTPLYDEIANASDAIQSHLGYRPNLFCYPNGAFDDESRTALRNVPGMQAAIYTHVPAKGEALEDSTAPMSMYRLSARGDDTIATFMNRLAPYANVPTQTPTLTPTPVPQIAPVGNQDTLSCTSTAGWACDGNDYNKALTVNIYDGPIGAGGTLLGSVVANQSRPDLITANVCGGTGNHGFSFNLPSTINNGANHQIYAYAVNIGPAGGNPLLSSSPKSITCAVPATANPALKKTTK